MTNVGYTSRCLRPLLVLLAVSLTPMPILAEDSPEKPTLSTPSTATVQSAYGKLPLSFEANQGQVDAQIQFLARGRGQALYLTPSQAVLTVRTGETKTDGGAEHAVQHKPLRSPSNIPQSVVRMTFAGADSAAKVARLEPLPGIVNYFIGDDPSR
ncbi:exported hypothetical protein [Candidatus Nitrospira nitrosa]|uniref:DUF7948 domain-containing protein n=1 Tax=Candidatus Nitrospira nitrosa TaxID=1742972 RepID=A0A0S4L5A5_9BACT|nr:hypothetical protein [Candidatus Nitrospira nitrosa]CUS31872.1 exported hypothetical protein [Candidatus Nitrospira nitrosa]